MGYVLKLLYYQIFCFILYLYVIEGLVLYFMFGIFVSVVMFVKSEFYDYLFIVVIFGLGKNGVCYDVND